MLTGPTRKEVKNVIDGSLSMDQRERTYLRPERVLTRWYSNPLFRGLHGIRLELPYESGASGDLSFTEIVFSLRTELIEELSFDGPSFDLLVDPIRRL